jgi:hypothetical protein
MPSTINIGDTDGEGYILLARRWPVELFKTPGGFFEVCLKLDQDKYLSTIRKNREDADVIYDNVCNMIQP